MSKKKPPDNEYTRASDPQNKTLSPGVRAINWAKAATTAWPVVLGLAGLLGYTNKDHIEHWVGLAEADGKTEITDDAADRWSQVQKFSTEVRAELEQIKLNSAEIKRQLAAKDQSNYAALRKLVDSIDERVKLIEEVVQP
ncbi:MAG: hypothetical protein OEQ39_04220 [Gammaproteobacteria bacterium]|nr:hypothetical protein [Gammaproteobacteria bacterium]